MSGRTKRKKISSDKRAAEKNRARRGRRAMRLSTCAPRREKRSVERHGGPREGRALGARTKLGSYEDSSTRRGNYQQEAG
jgi:hypothetical protein